MSRLQDSRCLRVVSRRFFVCGIDQCAGKRLGDCWRDNWSHFYHGRSVLFCIHARALYLAHFEHFIVVGVFYGPRSSNRTSDLERTYRRPHVFNRFLQFCDCWNCRHILWERNPNSSNPGLPYCYQCHNGMDSNSISARLDNMGFAGLTRSV